MQDCAELNTGRPLGGIVVEIYNAGLWANTQTHTSLGLKFNSTDCSGGRFVPVAFNCLPANAIRRRAKNQAAIISQLPRLSANPCSCCGSNEGLKEENRKCGWPASRSPSGGELRRPDESARSVRRQLGQVVASFGKPTSLLLSLSAVMLVIVIVIVAYRPYGVRANFEYFRDSSKEFPIKRTQSKV